MSGAEPDVDRLRAALRAASEKCLPREGCPPAERIWGTLQRELPAEDRREVVDHLAGCPSCSEIWRLGVEMLPAPQHEAATARPWWAWIGERPLVPLAAAAALVIAVGASLLSNRSPRGPEAPGYREGNAPRVLSLLPEDEPLPRDAFRLRWSAGPEGTRYDVRVTTEALEPVAFAAGLLVPEWEVPESALAPLPSGARLLWQVELRLAGGEKRDSETFVATLR